MGLMRTVVAPDGARLGVEAIGAGPPILLVHGGTADRTRWYGLAEQLAPTFTTWLLDRRGRGASRDEPDGEYALAREAADVAAVADAVGATSVLAHSYGALCALAAVGTAAGIRRLIAYEPPLAVDGHHVLPAGFGATLRDHVAQGRRDEALAVFLRDVVGLDDADIAARRGSADWRARVAALPTAIREAAALEQVGLRTLDLPAVELPVTVLVGSETTPALAAAARAVAGALPQGELVVLDGHGHCAMDEDPRAFAELVVRLWPAPALR